MIYILLTFSDGVFAIDINDNNVLKIYFDHLPTNFDGRKTLSFAQWTTIYNISDRLIEISNNGILKQNLVKSYKVIKNAKEFDFIIDKNRTFHDNSKITVDDIIYSLQLA